MKAIISHDVDHITVWEHNHDLIIPKFLVRNLIELTHGTISGKEFWLRFRSIFENKWQNINELMFFDKSHEVKSTFFVGVANGMSLRYSLKLAKFWIREILAEGFDVGVHGISYQDLKGILQEHDKFREISGLETFGIRMHYLRTGEQTLYLLDKAGYLFDSTLYSLKAPFRIGRMWEFPLHIMDGNVFYTNGHWQDITLKEAKDLTKRITERADQIGVRYFTVLFHDRYFSEEFGQWKEWYMWLISYLKDNGVPFIDYRGAIDELRNSS